VSDFGAAPRFYRDQLGLAKEALYDDPPYATLTADRPGVAMAAPFDPVRTNVVLVLEVPDADVARKALAARGVRFLTDTYRPPWGGSRFFCVDPDGYLVEIEQPAS
jgi:predicted enzyme related to lactoylglutathione lyase